MLVSFFASKTGFKSLLLMGAMAFVAACSDSGNSNQAAGPIDPPVDPAYPGYTIVELEPGDDLETRALEALISASPRTVIQFPAGTYDFTSELSSSVDNIVIRGTGMDSEAGTVLRFDNQVTGAQGIYATGNNFVIEDIAVENTPGDSIKVEGSNGVTIRRVRVEWTRGPNTDNGGYALYPVQTRNVLIEDSWIRGASDSGIYVGQSVNIIVRRNYVWENVAGIEIENSKFADVYENEATGNTGGILVFDLPGPEVQGGEATRVFNNNIHDNNEPNFARKGSVLEVVPQGTGILVMANDDDEIFDNVITGNMSGAIYVVSYYMVDAFISKPTYDPIPEKIYIHDNDISNNGYDPQDLAALVGVIFPNGLPVIFYDSSGIGTDSGMLLLEYPDGLTESQAMCFQDNRPETTMGQANGSVLLSGIPGDPDINDDRERFNCTHPSLPPVVLEPPVDPDDPDAPPVDTAKLCGAQGEGLNSEAFVADCPNLSDYRLFADASDPTQNPNGGGIIYDLNTPLFTDYAGKYRFVFVPEGTQATYRSQDVFAFPVGTVIAKTFVIKADLRDDNSAEDIIETRLLIRRKEGWTALPYTWNASRTDATLTLAGGTQNVSWIDSNGDQQSTDYVIPNTNNCANCHNFNEEILPIGPKARALNKEYMYDSGSANQLDHWTAQGILTGAPTDTGSIDTIPLWGDTMADLDDRARGYLDANCMHCHTPGGAADTSGLFLEYFRPFGFDTGECKKPVAAGGGGGGLDYDIVPGDAAASILHYRMDSNDTEVRMPEIGRTVIHTEAVALIEEWINSMPANDCAGN
ncbi:MAG: right-handed parallel beta-helix repeat-containing protein [Halioglobus sp.]|nr:right-handed parallel beta-helix repeat-containing protein [Halioglobus sp.]